MLLSIWDIVRMDGWVWPMLVYKPFTHLRFVLFRFFFVVVSFPFEMQFVLYQMYMQCTQCPFTIIHISSIVISYYYTNDMHMNAFIQKQFLMFVVTMITAQSVSLFNNNFNLFKFVRFLKKSFFFVFRIVRRRKNNVQCWRLPLVLCTYFTCGHKDIVISFFVPVILCKKNNTQMDVQVCIFFRYFLIGFVMIVCVSSLLSFSLYAKQF